MSLYFNKNYYIKNRVIHNTEKKKLLHGPYLHISPVNVDRFAKLKKFLYNKVVIIVCRVGILNVEKFSNLWQFKKVCVLRHKFYTIII